jgi:hypothetical protein
MTSEKSKFMIASAPAHHLQETLTHTIVCYFVMSYIKNVFCLGFWPSLGRSLRGGGLV